MNGIEITEVASKGRGLIATKKFETGRLVLGEEPYAYVIMSNYVDKVCHFCLRSTHVPGKAKSLSKCSGCNYARYCCKDCQKKAWKAHKLECFALQRVFPGQPCDQTRLVARMLWKREADLKLGSKYASAIESLEAHLSKRNDKEREALEEKVFSFGDYFTYEQMPESDDEMMHLFAAIDCNAIGLNDSKSLQTVGVGIYPIASMLNHDCNPNCVAINNGFKLEVHAIRPIQPNEELCICYVDCLDTTEGRQENLMKQYYFQCHCEICDDGNEIEALKNGLLRKNTKEESVRYIIQFSKDMLKRIEQAKEKQNWGRMSNQAIGTLAQQDCVLSDTHVLKMAVLNHAVEVQSFLRRNESALEFAERVAIAYERLLPPIHPRLGMYLMRLGILKWQLQKNENAIETLGRAANIISKSFGEDHPIFRELLELIKQCRMESHMSKSAQREFRLAKKKAGMGLPSLV